MKLSVITVCKNSEKTIEKAIISVVNQTYLNIEYIIVDGDSQDSTKEIIAKYSTFIKNFINEPDRCLWEAMNKGIRMATGDFIYFLNSDDYLIDEHVVKDVVNFIIEHPSCDFVYGDIQIRSISGDFNIQKSPLPEEILEGMVTGCIIPHSGSFTKRELFFKLGFFNESYKIGSDYEWVTKLMQDEKLKIFYYPRTIASFYGGGLSSNLRENLSEMFAIQNNVEIYQSEYWLKKRIVMLQRAFVDNYEFLQKVQNLSDEREILIKNLQDLVDKREAIIISLKTSKFGKLRAAWHLLKKIIK